MAHTDQRVEVEINEAIQIQKNISEGLDVLAASVSQLKGILQSTDNKAYVEQLLGTNGPIPSMPHDHARKQQFAAALRKLFEQVNIKNQEMVNLIRNVYCTLKSLVENLTNQVKKWQSQFQLYYAKLSIQPDLEQIAPLCAQVGQIIQQLLVGSFADWENILKQIPVNNPEMFLAEYQTQQSAFQSLMTYFLQSTFLVTEQGEFYIKTLKKCFPSFRSRVLAADYLFDHSGDVTAHFISELNMKECFHGEELDIETLKKKEVKVIMHKNQKSQKKLSLKSQKSTAKMECCCEGLQFEKQFKRQQTKETKVHEEKFRVVFVTKMESKTLWTMSLPLVVITASNQEAASLASIMWQCTSTNVFSVEEVGVTPTELKWSAVAWMLKQKISVISPSHSLTQENITHLKNRLFGKVNQRDDALVSLTQFCWVPMKGMKDASVSFWKWFLGSFNIIEDYLLDYWKDGLIMGFVKRQDAEKMLLKCQRSGTFILRFSDSELSDSDGLKNVQGHLRASVFCIKLNKTKDAGKRNSAGQQELQTERVIENLELPDPPKNLANILEDERKQFYRFLYPGEKTRKELFNKYYIEEEENIKIYRKSTEVGPTIDDLQRTLKEISLTRNVASSNADPSLHSEPRMIKKPKRSKKISSSDDDSVIDQENSTQVISTFSHSPLTTEQNTCAERSPDQSAMSPCYLDQSPLQSVPAPTIQMHFMDGPNQDSVVPELTDKPILPTILEDMEDFETTLPKKSSRKTVCKENKSPQTPAVSSHSDLESMSIKENAGNITSGVEFASSDEVHQSVNEFDLSLGDTSMQEREGRIIRQAIVIDHPTGGADWREGGIEISEGNGSLFQGQLPILSGGQTIQANDSSEKLIVSLDSLEISSKLSASTLEELKQNLHPSQYGTVLLWTNKGNECLTVANETEVGGNIVDIHTNLDDIEADGVFIPDAVNVGELDEFDDSFQGLEDYLETSPSDKMLSDDLMPDLKDIDFDTL